MDVSLSEHEAMLRESAKSFLTRECLMSLVREIESDPLGYSPTLWKKMAELGWLRMALPRQHGGEGNSFFDVALITEQMGAVLLPSPFIATTAAGLAVTTFGNDKQKELFLPAIGAGDLVVSLAILEPDMGLDADLMFTAAERRDHDFLLFGTKTYVSDFKAAGVILCTAKTDRGPTVFMLDPTRPGVVAEELSTMASDKQWEITLRGVRVSQVEILGEEGQADEVVENILRNCACLVSAYATGAADRVLTLTKEYTKSRKQFGKPVGAFQVIQHKIADMLVMLEGARLITYEAAWKISQGLPVSFEASAAKAWVADSAHKIAEESMRIHASMGYAMECDIQLFYRRATSLKVAWGDPYFHRERVAQAIGL